ncbi:MAG: Maf family protein [Ruminococcus sp.]|nr:Maf family protein [Ruminococcus sp.]
MSVILASASPRRKELLKYAVSDFTVIPSKADETLPDDITAEQAAEYLAVRKAEEVAAEHEFDAVIGCDTVVIIDGEILGKPANINVAREMLRRLSGRTHRVVTGVCIIRRQDILSFSECTEVEFYPLTDREIEEYVNTGDPMDKAGAYGIQSEGCVLVKGIKGDFFNVAGLPVARLKRELEKFGAL